MKRCGRCKEDKPSDAFAMSSRKGLQSYCRQCHLEWKREWSKNNREKIKWNIMYSKYRLRREDYEQLLEEQGGMCKICREVLLKPEVDHDHVTGEVRGLLCRHCNVMVGWMELHPNRIDLIHEYLRKSPVTSSPAG